MPALFASPPPARAWTDCRAELDLLREFLPRFAAAELSLHDPHVGRRLRWQALKALERTLVWGRVELAERGELQRTYAQLAAGAQALEARLPGLDPEQRLEAERWLRLLPVPGQWARLNAELAKGTDADVESRAVAARERARIAAKLAAKPQAGYKLRHFCQVLRSPKPGSPGVLRIFALPYALFATGLLERIATRYGLFVEPVMGVVCRHTWWRHFVGLDTPVLFGAAGAEDRAFLAGQGLDVTRLAHGHFLPDAPPVTAEKRVDIVFNATFKEMERKRHGRLLELLAAPELAKVTALVLGRGTEAEVDDFRAMVRATGLEARVRVEPNLRRADVPARLATARMGVHLSLYENAPRCVMEFFRAGLPCVVPESMAGIDFGLFNPLTGAVAREANLARTIAEVLSRVEHYDPRGWFLGNSGSAHSTTELEDELALLFVRHSLAWSGPLAQLGSSGASRYTSAASQEACTEDYAWLAQVFRETGAAIHVTVA